jgi:CheY-like chemotaxis protein
MKKAITTFLIDDDNDDQEIFSFVIKEVSHGAECVFANDGINALEKINTNASFIPDIIFIDINMPRMNGVKCLAEIKKISRLQNVRVYMYSTSAEVPIVQQCKKLGATGFIKKYIDTADLKTELTKIVSQLKITA